MDALLDEVFGGSSDPGSSDEGDDDDDDHALTYEQHGALLRAVRGQQGGAARQVADPNAAVRSEAYTEGEHNLNPGGAAGSVVGWAGGVVLGVLQRCMWLADTQFVSVQ